YNIAALHHFRGEHALAISLLLSTRESCRDNKDEYHVALCHLDLSEIYLELSRSKEAESMAQQAAADFQRLGMNYEAGKSLANLALATWQQGKPIHAFELFAKARKMLVDEESQIWPSRIDLYRAMVLIERGAFDDARRLCLKALAVFRSSRTPHNLILCQLLLARSYLRRGSRGLARRHCSSARGHLRSLELPVLHCEGHQVMGLIHKAANHLPQARRSLKRARYLFEALRSGLTREELKTSFMKNRLAIYEELVNLCLRAPRGSQRLEEAFENIEQSKSRSLRDLMFKSRSEFQLAANLSPDLRRR